MALYHPSNESARRIKKSDIPTPIYLVLKERGHSEEAIESMSPRQMVAEWTAWEIGDPAWGWSIFDFIGNMGLLKDVD